MNLEIVSVVATGVGILIGVWRIQAHYEARNDAAHADLGRRIDSLATSVNARIDKLYELLSTKIT